MRVGLKRLASWLGLVLVAGCASGPGAVSQDGPLPEATGLMGVQIVSNDNRSWRAWTYIEIWSMDRSELSLAYAVPKVLRTTTVFLQPLPPGRYRIDAAKNVEQQVDHKIVRTAILKDALGTFEIKTGQLTDLGTIVIQQEKNLWVNRGFGVGYRPDSVVSDLVQHRYDVVAKQIQGKPVLGWTQLPERDKLSAVSAAAAATPARMNRPKFSAGGELVVGAKLGQVLVRSQAGAWRRYDTGVSVDITSGVVLQNAELLVGTEYGWMLLSEANRTRWRFVRLPKPGGVDDIELRRDGAYYLLVHHYDSDGLLAEYPVGVFRSAANDLRNWQPLVERTGGNMALVYPLAAAFMTEDPFTVFFPTFVIDRLNSGWSDWSRTRPPFILNDAPRVASDGTVYCIGWRGFGGHLLSAMPKGAADWERRYQWPDGAIPLSVVFATPELAYAMVKIDPKERAEGQKGRPKERYELQRSTDGGKSWRSWVETPPAVGLVLLAGGNELLAYNHDGTVLRIRQQGAWDYERKPEN